MGFLASKAFADAFGLTVGFYLVKCANILRSCNTCKAPFLVNPTDYDRPSLQGLTPRT